ncbi:MAG: hypothetical protein ABH950_08940 [Candidatus Altiarchaeota archaeon]
MKKILLFVVLIFLASFCSAQKPFTADIKINGVSVFGGVPVLKAGETATVTYGLVNNAGSDIVYTGLTVSASPPAVEALLDKYLSPYYSRQESMSSGWSKSGSQSIDLPSILPAGEYTATGKVSYTTAGGGAQTGTYTAKFRIESSGIISKVLGAIVKYVPKSIASKIIGLFG